MGAKTPEADNCLMHSRKPDFSGWATKANLKCSDGRTIMPGAFKHQDKLTVPLVWQHGHNDPGNVLGHAVLEHRDEGVYTHGYFNDSDQAANAKTLVQHEDIKSLSIFANKLVEKSQNVMHGFIREVSLVLSGANPGALIDNIELQHADGDNVLIEDEAVIYTGLALEHADGDQPGVSGSTAETPEGPDEDDADGPTVQDVYDDMSDDQKNVVHYMIGAALEGADSSAEHSSTTTQKEGRTMPRNVFEQAGSAKEQDTPRHELSHDDMKGIAADAVRRGSFKEAVEDYAIKHGIDNIDILFPDARTITSTPEWDSRRVEWVKGVLNGTKHSPFSRIKSIIADITHDEARAKGYIKGSLKKEEFFGLTKRTTTPATVYKKQKLDRDDILDITDMDVVAWLKGEMRLMLDEEIARAVLIGDGRDIDDEDKIKDPQGQRDGEGIRSILHDHDLYAATVTVNVDDANSKIDSEVADAILLNMQYYKGTGSPTFYTTLPVVTKMLLARDDFGRRMYRTQSELASELGVSNIVTVEVMETEEDLLGIIVNLQDYTIGADKGGEVSLFDDFDIDYNQYKYLIETRISGGLTKIRSALIVRRAQATSVEVKPESPAYNADTRVITPKTTTGVVYKRADTNATVTTGSPITLNPNQELKIYAVPANGYFFGNNIDDEFTFKGKA